MDLAYEIAVAKMKYATGEAVEGENILNRVLFHLAPGEYPELNPDRSNIIPRKRGRPRGRGQQ